MATGKRANCLGSVPERRVAEGWGLNGASTMRRQRFVFDRTPVNNPPVFSDRRDEGVQWQSSGSWSA